MPYLVDDTPSSPINCTNGNIHHTGISAGGRKAAPTMTHPTPTVARQEIKHIDPAIKRNNSWSIAKF